MTGILATESGEPASAGVPDRILLMCHVFKCAAIQILLVVRLRLIHGARQLADLLLILDILHLRVAEEAVGAIQLPDHLTLSIHHGSFA